MHRELLSLDGRKKRNVKLFQKQPSHNILIGFSGSLLGTKEKALIAGMAEAEGIHKLWPDIEHEYQKKVVCFFHKQE